LAATSVNAENILLWHGTQNIETVASSGKILDLYINYRFLGFYWATSTKERDLKAKSLI
jgi:hypothetical protein